MNEYVYIIDLNLTFKVYYVISKKLQINMEFTNYNKALELFFSIMNDKDYSAHIKNDLSLNGRTDSDYLTIWYTHNNKVMPYGFIKSTQRL